ncbi:MAG: hypothetical protein MHM6MM_009009 [Cercozoa sp. M6MM]
MHMANLIRHCDAARRCTWSTAAWPSWCVCGPRAAWLASSRTSEHISRASGAPTRSELPQCGPSRLTT